MRTRLAMLVGALVLALSAPAALAQSIHERMEQMERRIERGIASKELTRREAEKLREELREIKRRERRMRADGRLGQRDREILNADLDRLSRHITRERRDDETRRPRY